MLRKQVGLRCQGDGQLRERHVVLLAICTDIPHPSKPSRRSWYRAYQPDEAKVIQLNRKDASREAPLLMSVLAISARSDFSKSSPSAQAASLLLRRHPEQRAYRVSLRHGGDQLPKKSETAATHPAASRRGIRGVAA